MKDMLQMQNVQIVPHVGSWQEAIKVSVMPLVEGGYVEPRYIDGIMENTALYGPYYVMAPDLALIHARAEQGVIKKQVAVTVVKDPIKFSDDGYDVRLLVVLAAEDSESHGACMAQLAGIFSDEERMQQIINAQSAQEVYNYFMM